MTLDALAALHARCFRNPRPWTAEEFASLLDTRGTFLLEAPQGFLIGRSVVDEAELLTLAVAPEARRQGVARALMAQFRATSLSRGAAQAFLEVASDNAAALALYTADGWERAGLRRHYYAPGVDAILMRRPL